MPDDWKCPDCLVGKADFEMMEIRQATKIDTPFSSNTVKQAPIVIIGAGYAGYNLVEAIRQRDTETPYHHFYI